MKPAIERIDIAAEELNQLLERAREALPEEDYLKLKAALETLEYLTELVADKDTTIRHLRQLLLPASEKTKVVLEKIGIEPAANTPKEPPAENEPEKAVSPRPGHGRNSAAEFTGAKRVEIPHQQLHHGDRCPECGKGNVYGQKEPKVLVRVVELPQLWNVIRGDMSLVGPRPAVPEEVGQYKRWQRRRLRMRPGLTCLWAIEGRDELDFETWMRKDMEYIDTWSLALDWRILLLTIPRVLLGRGAH